VDVSGVMKNKKQTGLQPKNAFKYNLQIIALSKQAAISTWYFKKIVN
jgi:hypothetical protein